MKKTVVILFLLSFSIIFYACKHSGPELPIDTASGGGTGPTGPSGPTGPALVCFESEVLPIFQTNCAKSGCHDAASRREGYVFDSYVNIMRKDIRPYNAANSKVYKVLFEDDDDRMPQWPNPPLTTAQKNIIGRWINEGAKETKNCGSACNPAEFKFAANIKPIMETHCTGCHSGGSPAAGLNLSTYAGVHASRNMVLNRITHPDPNLRMPKGADPLPDCKITQIRNWIQAGAPNN